MRVWRDRPDPLSMTTSVPRSPVRSASQRARVSRADSGVAGTLRRSRATPGRAHLKTGSLRDVAAVAGYVLTHNGRRLVVVAIINHANAQAARPALDAVVQWALRDTPLR